jgi:hypothetical protein
MFSLSVGSSAIGMENVTPLNSMVMRYFWPMNGPVLTHPLNCEYGGENA